MFARHAKELQAFWREKKEQGRQALLQKLCRPFSRYLDLILIGGRRCLLRVRVPPETWTTSRPRDRTEGALLDQIVQLVTIFGNDCSNFEHLRKRLEIDQGVAIGIRTRGIIVRIWAVGFVASFKQQDRE
jgi:hypothetical protein